MCKNFFINHYNYYLSKVVHGTHDTVNFICDNPDIKAVSFVGGDAAGKHIYNRASAAGKTY